MHDARVKGAGAAAQGVERKGGGDIRGIDENFRVMQREAQKGQHALRAIQERKAFFCFERNGLDSCAAQCIAAGDNFVFIGGAAFADDDRCKMRKRREIAGSADGTLRRNHGMDSGVQHRAERFDNQRAHAAQAFGESVRAQKHHGARFCFA